MRTRENRSLKMAKTNKPSKNKKQKSKTKSLQPGDIRHTLMSPSNKAELLLSPVGLSGHPLCSHCHARSVTLGPSRIWPLHTTVNVNSVRKRVFFDSFFFYLFILFSTAWRAILPVLCSALVRPFLTRFLQYASLIPADFQHL